MEIIIQLHAYDDDVLRYAAHSVPSAVCTDEVTQINMERMREMKNRCSPYGFATPSVVCGAQ